MTPAPAPGPAIKTELSHLLADLTRCGIALAADPSDPSALRYRPRAALTPDLAERVRLHKGELLAILAGEPQQVRTVAATMPQGAPRPASAPTYTPAELQALAGCPPAVRATVDRIKVAFADFPRAGAGTGGTGGTGGVTVLSAGPDPDCPARPRERVALAIRGARRRGERCMAAALRDAWRERVAICILDGGLSVADAEIIAAEYREITCRSVTNHVGLKT